MVLTRQGSTDLDAIGEERDAIEISSDVDTSVSKLCLVEGREAASSFTEVKRYSVPQFQDAAMALLAAA